MPLSERSTRNAGISNPIYVPVPARLTVRRPPPPPFTFSVADLAPFVVGRNVTLIVQVAWAAIELPQLLEEANWLDPVPVIAMLVMATTLALVFVTVTDFAVLAVLSN